jgi:WXG100 family type VII secretion target
MAERIGASIEQLTELKSTFDREAQNIEALVGNIGGRLADTDWEGGAAERFRAQWASEFEPSLRNLRQALEEAGLEVARRRDNLVQGGS